MNDQATNLRRKLEVSKQLRIAKTISIVSGKGGVGKSNFALNFSLELLNNGKKVLLFDLDLGMGNIDILLGLHAKKTVIDMLNDQLTVHDIIENGNNGLAYIAGGSGVTDLFSMDRSKITHFFKQYDELVQMYDYIIFDIGAGATDNNIFFILASDECIVITTPEPTSIMDGYGMIKHIVNKQSIMPIYVVMNRCSSQRSGKQYLERFQRVVFQFLNVQIKMMGILPDDKAVSKAVMMQTPYLILDDTAPISKALKQITENYLSGSNKLNNKKPFSFIEKLKQLVRER